MSKNKIIKILFITSVFLAAISLSGCSDSNISTNQSTGITQETNSTEVLGNTQTPVQKNTPVVDKSVQEEPKNNNTNQNNQTSSDSFSVTKVVDGDTFKVSIDGLEKTIRLIGLDTPETVDPRKPVQCFGIEASNKAKELLSGKKVKLEADPSQGDLDKYGRLLRYAFLEDGTSFNKWMIANGYGHEYTYNLPYKYQTEFKEAERLARENKLGLWADNVCVDQGTTNIINTDTNINTQTSSFSCSGKKTCSEMINCDEAKFYLNNCGVSRLDGDKDGIPCESLCK